MLQSLEKSIVPDAKKKKGEKEEKALSIILNN